MSHLYTEVSLECLICTQYCSTIYVQYVPGCVFISLAQRDAGVSVRVRVRASASESVCARAWVLLCAGAVCKGRCEYVCNVCEWLGG
jgi:hypothetical protein